MPLARNTWEILIEHGLCHYAQGERQLKFRGLASIYAEDLSNFGGTQFRLLKASLLTDLCTADKYIMGATRNYEAIQHEQRVGNVHRCGYISDATHKTYQRHHGERR